MTGRLEHVNITVRNPDESAAVLCRIFGWHERWRGGSKAGGTSIHIGTTAQYLVMYGRDPDAPATPDAGGVAGGMNHVGVVVDDLDTIEARVIAEGLVPYAHDDYEPGRRFYFDDRDGVEYEVVSYNT